MPESSAHSEDAGKKFSWKNFILDVGLDVIIVVIMVLFIRTFVFSPFRVHGPSMCNTFNYYSGECLTGDGEFLITSKLPTWSIFGFSFAHIERGDVVVFDAPYTDEEYYIKRVIGLPGETVKIADGFVYIKNAYGEYQMLNETYLNEENWGHTTPHRTESQEFNVPEGKYFVLGDNRTKSSDSRRCFQSLGCTGDSSPFLDANAIAGEAKLVAFPLSHFRWISNFDYSSSLPLQ